jgi:nucleotide-binding universal stress UspA family protein
MLPRHLAGKRDEMSDTVSPVIVGVDGTYTAIRAARWSAAVDDRFGAPLCIVYAKSYLRHNSSEAIAGVRAAAMAEQEESALAILRSADLRLTRPDEACFSGAAPRERPRALASPVKVTVAWGRRYLCEFAAEWHPRLGLRPLAPASPT